MASFEVRDRWALVTGASSGIGRELARGLGRRGAHLVLVARSVEPLRELEQELVELGVRVLVLPMDLSEPAAPARLHAQLLERGIAIRVLVNNAGVGRARALAADSPAPVLRMLDLNCRALTELTLLFLPELVASGDAAVLLVASLVGFFPVPEMAAYAASKAYVRSLGEALAAELSGTGVHVTVLCPGNVPSGFQAAAGFEAGAATTPGMLTAERTAELALRGLLQRRGRVIPGFMNKLAAFGTSLLPNPWIARIASLVLRRSGRFA